MLEVRDHQARIVNHVVQAVEDGHKAIPLESPTGSGRSLMAHLVAQRLHDRYGWTAGWTGPGPARQRGSRRPPRPV